MPNSRCFARKTRYFSSMSTQEILLEEIKHQPEPVLRELRHYLDFLKRQENTNGRSRYETSHTEN
jgi:hypothetical protein